MGWQEKYVYGEAGVRHLVFGIVSIIIAVGLILVVYGYVSGAARIGDIIFEASEALASWFLIYGFFALGLGLLGGFEVGRYVQTEFTKRQKLQVEKSSS